MEGCEEELEMSEQHDHQYHNGQRRTKTSSPNMVSSGTRRDEDDERQKMAAVVSENQELVKENQRLRRCMGGVKVMGKALKETKKEIRELRLLSYGNSSEASRNHQHPDKVTDEVPGGPIQSKDEPWDEEMVFTQRDVPKKAQGKEYQVTQGKTEEPDTPVNARRTSTEDQHHIVSTVMQVFNERGDTRQRPADGARDLERAAEQVHKTTGCLGEMPHHNSRAAEDNQTDRDGEGSVSRRSGDATGPASSDDPALEGNTTSHRPSEMNQTRGDGSTINNDGVIIGNDGMTVDVARLQKVSSGKETLQAATRKVYEGTSGGCTANEGDGIDGSKSAVEQHLGLEIIVKELRKANAGWEKHCSKKTAEFTARLQEKDATFAMVTAKLEDACAEVKRKAEQYDEMLLGAKSRFNQIEERNKSLESELNEEVSKRKQSEKLNRNLMKQHQSMADETIRLKTALEKKYQPITPVPADQEAHCACTSPTPLTEGASQSSRAAGLVEARRTVSPAEATLKIHDAPMSLKAGEIVGSTISDDHEVKSNSVAEKNLGKDELKERLELYRQQTKAYESDFVKERKDREKAIEELHKLQCKLHRERKTRLQGGQTHRMHGIEGNVEMNGELLELEPTTNVKGPRRTVYRPPVDHKTPRDETPARRAVIRQQTHEPVHTRDKELKVATRHGGLTTTVVNPGAIIIHSNPEGQLFNVVSVGRHGGRSQKTPKGTAEMGQSKMEPFQCPRCQKIFSGSNWDSYEYHVTLCTVH